MATQAQLIEAINDAGSRGWKVTKTGLGYLITSSASDVDHDTPASWPKSWWGAPTYRKLFQLSVTVNGQKIILAQTRISTAPGGAASESKVSFAKAIDFLYTDHGKDGS